MVNMSHCMTKPLICICKYKGELTVKLIFVLDTWIVQFFYCSKSKKQPLSIFSACTGRFVVDLFGNHIVGFFMKRLNYDYPAILVLHVLLISFPDSCHSLDNNQGPITNFKTKQIILCLMTSPRETGKIILC